MLTTTPAPITVRHPLPLRHYVEAALKEAPNRTRAEILAPVDGMPLSFPELRQAFDMIANADDWRAPIHAMIPKEWDNACALACVFFTATTLTFMEAPNAKGMLIVTAPGYRAGPAGP